MLTLEPVVLFLVMVQEALLDQVPDIQRSWINKLFGFTVLKPTERSATPLGTMIQTRFYVAFN